MWTSFRNIEEELPRKNAVFSTPQVTLEYSQDIFNFAVISHLLLMYNIHERITEFYKDAASVQVKIFVFCWDSQSPLHVYIFNFIFETCILCIYVIFTFIHLWLKCYILHKYIIHLNFATVSYHYIVDCFSTL